MRSITTDGDQTPLAAWEAAVRAHEASLTVGTRVRVRLSGECRSMEPEGNGWPHADWHDGVVGTIEKDDLLLTLRNARPGHRFVVHADQPIGGYFATCAAELVPLDTAGAEDGAR